MSSAYDVLVYPEGPAGQAPRLVRLEAGRHPHELIPAGCDSTLLFQDRQDRAVVALFDDNGRYKCRDFPEYAPRPGDQDLLMNQSFTATSPVLGEFIRTLGMPHFIGPVVVLAEQRGQYVDLPYKTVQALGEAMEQHLQVHRESPLLQMIREMRQRGESVAVVNMLHRDWEQQQNKA